MSEETESVELIAEANLPTEVGDFRILGVVSLFQFAASDVVAVVGTST